MPSHEMKRPTLISVFSDQRRTKSTTSSRTSCVPSTQSVSVSPPPGGEDAPSIERRTLRSRRTLSASGKTPSAAGPVLHTDPKLALCPKGAASEPQPSLQQCSACALFSYVRSAILTDERFLHFQLRRDKTK